MNIKYGVFVFALLKVGEVLGWVRVFLYELRYDRFDSRVKASFLAARS